MGIINENERLVIKDATRVLWVWYDYCREHTYENLYVRQYTKSADGKIIFEHTIHLHDIFKS